MLKLRSSYTCRNRKYTIYVVQLLKKRNRKSAYAVVFYNNIAYCHAHYTLKGTCLGFHYRLIEFHPETTEFNIRDLDVLQVSISFENATKILEQL